MAGEYPPLPNSDFLIETRGTGVRPAYSADQMRAYVDADRASRPRLAPQDGQGEALTQLICLLDHLKQSPSAFSEWERHYKVVYAALSGQAAPAEVSGARVTTEDEAAAIKFYAENPRAALFDLRRRLATPAASAPISQGVPVEVARAADATEPVRFFWENRPESATQAMRDVMGERYRQMMVEGWTVRHDDEEHKGGDLALAAGSYAIHAGMHSAWDAESYAKCDPPEGDPEVGQHLWPWDREWWKPKNYRRDLVRAAALAVAAIEQFDRRAAIASTEQPTQGEKP